MMRTHNHVRNRVDHSRKRRERLDSGQIFLDRNRDREYLWLFTSNAAVVPGAIE
jgi:hypothetical protein